MHEVGYPGSQAVINKPKWVRINPWVNEYLPVKRILLFRVQFHAGSAKTIRYCHIDYIIRKGGISGAGLAGGHNENNFSTKTLKEL